MNMESGGGMNTTNTNENSPQMDTSSTPESTENTAEQDIQNIEGEKSIETSQEEVPLSEEEMEIGVLSELYDDLHTKETEVAKLTATHKKIEEIRARLGASGPLPEENAGALAELDAIKKNIEQKENSLLQKSMPEEVKAQLENLDRSTAQKNIEWAFAKKVEKEEGETKEKWIEKLVEACVELDRPVFARAENGTQAEALFRIKLAGCLRAGMDNKDTEEKKWTYTQISTAVYEKDGKTLRYIGRIRIQNGDDDFSFNVPQDLPSGLSVKPARVEYNEGQTQVPVTQEIPMNPPANSATQESSGGKSLLTQFNDAIDKI